MGFTSYNEIINALTTGSRSQYLSFMKSSITSVAGYWYRLWNATGYPGGGPDQIPALTGSILTSAISGSLYFNDPTSPRTLHMVSFGAGGPTAGTVLLYDRLWQVSGLVLTSTAKQLIYGISGSTTRHPDGSGSQILLEMAVATTATAANFFVNYTNSQGVAGRIASIPLAAAEPINRCYFMTLQSGDNGVQSIQFASSSAAKTAGSVNLVLMNSESMVFIPFNANQFTERDLVLQMANLPRVLDDSCISFMVLASTTTTGVIQGRLVVAEN